MKEEIRSEEVRLEILKSHYQNWIQTARDESHKRYAQIMYNSILEGTHVKTYHSLSKNPEFTQPKQLWNRYTQQRMQFKKLGPYSNKEN